MNIKLNNILQLSELDNVRIRLNLSNNKWNALKLYHEDPEMLLIGNFHNSADRIEEDETGQKKNTKGKIWFKEGQIVIGLAQIQYDDWLLIDISRIKKSYNKVWDGESKVYLNTFYETETLDEYKKYFGRLVVRFHKNQAFVTMKGENIDRFIVKEILADSFDNDLFPGYENINISWNILKRVIEKDSWKTALINQKGVYLISDNLNGKRYIGAAYGQDMLLGRLKSYVTNGHGGNVELKKLTFDYIKENFTYSLLEIYKSTTDDQIIIDRESWWKDVLNTRKFGYNIN